MLVQENTAQLPPLPTKRTGPARRTRRAVLLETVAEEAADLEAAELPQTEAAPNGMLGHRGHQRLAAKYGSSGSEASWQPCRSALLIAA